MSDGLGPTNTTKNAGPNEPFGKKSKIVRRNPQMNTPATFAASNDRKTFSDNVRKELDIRAVARAQKALQHVQEADVAPFPEGDAVVEGADDAAYNDKMKKAFERNQARRKAAEGASTAKADKADKAHADRMKAVGSKSFISVRKG